MNECTYGCTEAAQKLADILGGSPSQIRAKASDALSFYRRGLNQLEILTDPEVQKTAAVLWRRDAITKVNESNLPQEVKSFLANVMVADFRSRGW